MYQQPEVDVLIKQSQLRRLTRTQRPKPKYVNTTIVEEATEAETFEEASQGYEWITTIKEDRCT